MSMADYRKEVGISANKPDAVTKYHNIKTTCDGIEFDSKLEAKRYGELKLLLKAGQIKSFKRQPSFLFESGIRYRPDFIAWGLDGIPWVEDSKGVRTKEFSLKLRLWKDEYPDMELRVIK